MADKTRMIGEILRVMAERWDLPPDCNEGELFTYAEILFDRISAGESKTALTASVERPDQDAANADVGSRPIQDAHPRRGLLGVTA